MNVRNAPPVWWVPEIIIITTPKNIRETFAWKDLQGETHDRDEEDIA